MKKLFVLFIFLLGCTDPKTKITERQKQILKEKNLINQKLTTTKDSSMPTEAELKEWDSLNAAAERLNSEYDSLQQELKKQ